MVQGESGWLYCGKKMVMVCVCVSREGVLLKREAGIFSNYSPSSPSHHAEQGRQSQARLLVLGACSPLPCSPPPLSTPQQLWNEHKITLIEFVSLQIKWIVKDKMTGEIVCFSCFFEVGVPGGSNGWVEVLKWQQKERVGGRWIYCDSIWLPFFSYCNELPACIIEDESFYSH